jgi:hypothetical protein
MKILKIPNTRITMLVCSKVDTRPILVLTIHFLSLNHYFVSIHVCKFAISFLKIPRTCLNPSVVGFNPCVTSFPLLLVLAHGFSQFTLLSTHPLFQ